MLFWVWLPNFLTLTRVILTPVISWLFILGEGYMFFAALLFTLAAFTDSCDGYCARTYGSCSKLGSILDPLADKILVTTMFILFWWGRTIEGWWLICMILRDIVVTSLRLYLTFIGKSLNVTFIAKSKTALQFLVINILFIWQTVYYYGKTAWWYNTGTIAIKIFMYFVLFLTLYSGLDYVYRTFVILKKNN
jgi:CDP-diacylglycerol--glycerol-3-phosphate 3-phosphatidyltransferase